MMMPNVLRAYADGGVIGRNPSRHGGTWAVYLMGFGDVIMLKRSGIVTPETEGMEAITNNYTELLACVQAMRSLPDAWDGDLFTDSYVTLCRLTNDRPGFKGIPEAMQAEVWEQRERMGDGFRVVLLDGHPTRAQLASGKGKRGNPVSEWNVACDKECGRLAVEFMKGLTNEKG